MIKVLWFCNAPANGVKFLKGITKSGGWLESLNQGIEGEIDLHIAFINPSGPREFNYGKTKYYSIIPTRWKKRLILRSIFGTSLEREGDVKYFHEIIEKVEPNIIHIHGSENGFIQILGKTKIPIIVSIQGLMSVIEYKYNQGLPPDFLRKTRQPFNLKSNIWPRNLQFTLKDIRKRKVRELQYLQLTEFVAGRTSWDNSITRVIAPNSKYFKVDRILREVYYINEWKAPNNAQFTLYSTTGSSVFKGIELIIETFKILSTRIPNLRWNVAGVSSNYSVVKKWNSKIPNGLNFLGNLSPENIVLEMKKADVYVMASHIENSPNNLAEAQYVGMPCVATNVGGTSTYIKDGESGVLVPPGDSYALSGAIYGLMKEPLIRKSIAEKGRSIALKRHNKSKVLGQVLDMYNYVYSKYDGF